MATTQAEYFLEHAASGELTDAQMAELLALPEGDTTGLLVEGGQPEPAPVDTTDKTPSAGVSTQQDPANAVVLAKDGVHTIPYEKLVEARDGEKHWKAQAEAAQAQLAQLQAQAEQRAAAGQKPTQQDNAVAQATAAIEAGVDPELFGDFSEEAIAKGVQKLVDARVAVIEAKFAEAMKPLQQKAQLTEAEKHFQAIYQAHPDADSLTESAELKAWIDSHPSFVRSGFQAVLQQGTTTQVVELFDAFKAATGKAQTPTAANAAATAKAVIDKAQSQGPASLSDIPGSAAGPADEFEAMRQMSATDLMGKLEGKTPEQIEALMARLL